MCENDAAVDAWFLALGAVAAEVSPDLSVQMLYRFGHMRGALRELAATVPDAREWLVANMPGEG